MANKLLKAVTNNLGFKILAVVLAFILWLAVYNIDDPKQTRTYTASVTIENASLVAEQNKCYEILEGTNSVTFAVTGNRSVLKNLEDSDFRAVADLGRMTLSEDGKTANVPIEISSIRSNSSLSYPNKKYLKIALEDLMSKRLVISAGTSGKVADGYALGDVTVTNSNVLKVDGPASIVSRVSSAVATIDVEGMSVNLSDNVVPVLYDANGKEVDTTRLTLSKTTVTVSARILVVKELKLAFSTVGEPGGDYSVVEITSSPQVVQVKGAASAVNPLTVVSIPEDLIDVSGMQEDLTTTIDIAEFLPEGVELVDSADAKVKVSVRIEPFKTSRYTVSTDHLQVNGLSRNCELAFSYPNVYVMISALQGNLDRLVESEITGVIDVSGLSEGTHQVPVTLDLDENDYVCHAPAVEVTITLKEDVVRPDEPGSPGNEDEPENPDQEEDPGDQDESENPGEPDEPESGEPDEAGSQEDAGGGSRTPDVGGTPDSSGDTGEGSETPDSGGDTGGGSGTPDVGGDAGGSSGTPDVPDGGE